MKILQNSTQNNPVLAAAIQRAARIISREYDLALPKGWQLIVKLKSGEETLVHLHLSEGEGGSYAKAKMSTLENFPEMPYTGADGTADVLYMLEKLNLDDSENADEICTVESPNLFTKEQREWLRDECEIASMYGGIRIPYEFLINADKEYQSINDGEILIAFSGATQEQDVFFALYVLRAIQHSLAAHESHVLHDYVLSDLHKNCVIGHWLQLMRIHDHDYNYSHDRLPEM